MRFLILLAALASAPLHATLLGRAPLTPGGTDYADGRDSLRLVSHEAAPEEAT
jgi:hypothetical protein